MSDITQLGLYVGSTAVINSSYQIANKQDPVPGLIGAGVLFGLLTFGSLIAGGRFEIAKAIALVTLLAALLYRGLPLLTALQNLITGAQTIPKSPTN